MVSSTPSVMLSRSSTDANQVSRSAARRRGHNCRSSPVSSRTLPQGHRVLQQFPDEAIAENRTGQQGMRPPITSRSTVERVFSHAEAIPATPIGQSSTTTPHAIEHRRHVGHPDSRLDSASCGCALSVTSRIDRDRLMFGSHRGHNQEPARLQGINEATHRCQQRSEDLSSGSLLGVAGTGHRVSVFRSLDLISFVPRCPDKVAEFVGASRQPQSSSSPFCFARSSPGH